MGKRLNTLIALVIFMITVNANAQNRPGPNSQKSKINNEFQQKDNEYSNFRLSLSGGWSTLIAPVSSSVPAYLVNFVEGLRQGINFSVEFNYFLSKQTGLGLKYNNFSSSNSAIINFPNGNAIIPVKLSVDQNFGFLGPVLCSRTQSANKKNSLLLGVGFGLMTYYSHLTLNDAKSIIQTGNTFGLSYDVGFEFLLAKNISLGFQLTYLKGMLTQYNENDGVSIKTITLTSANYESLSHFDLSVGLRFTPAPRPVKKITMN